MDSLENPAGPQAKRAVRLTLVNFSAMSADLLRVAFAATETIQIIGTATNASELAALLVGSPDIALIGSTGSRKDSTAIPYLEQIAEAGLPVRAVVISENMSREDVVAFFQHGARGLLCNAETDFTVLNKCILCVSAGQVWATSDQLEQLLCSLSQPRSLRVTNVVGEALLSQREEQVLHLLARGMSNRDLARALKLSEHTVKNHLFRIFDKLGVSNRMEAVLYAIRESPRQTLPASDAVAANSQTGIA